MSSATLGKSSFSNWMNPHVSTLQLESYLAILSHHHFVTWQRREKEVAMSIVIDLPHRDTFDRHQLWDRFERADLFEHYLDLQAQGVSQRQAAKQLQVPRTTLQAGHAWYETLDICPHVAEFFQSSPGLAFLHRLVLALHLVCVEVGAGGIRLVCLLLRLTGLDRFVAASYGAQQQVNLQVEQAIVAYRQAETAR
jgi:hypothetical protein